MQLRILALVLLSLVGCQEDAGDTADGGATGDGDSAAASAVDGSADGGSLISTSGVSCAELLECVCEDPNDSSCQNITDMIDTYRGQFGDDLTELFCGGLANTTPGLNDSCEFDGVSEDGGAEPSQVCSGCVTISSVQISGGAAHTCAVDDAGAVTCWGRNDAEQGQTDVPDSLGHIVQLSAGHTTGVGTSAGGSHTCAVDDAGAVACWGSDNNGKSTVPDALGTIVQVSSGDGHNCVLDDAGAVTCWGASSYGQSRAPESLGTIVQISAGQYHSCALDTAGAVTCWGNNRDDQRTVPSSLGTLVQVSAGANHTCALDDAGAVWCWGSNNLGQNTVPDSLGTIVQVSAGGNHTCALDNAGTVTCWGDDDARQTNVPGYLGTVVQISAGGSHTCSVDDAGGTACWGDNSLGQSAIPCIRDDDGETICKD